MSSSFRQILSGREHSEDWYQGRGIYGGLVFAQFVFALRGKTEFPIRRLTVDMCAPVLAGDIEIKVQEARKGVNSHFFYVCAIQGTKVVAHGSAVCGGARSNLFDIHTHPAPEEIPPTFDSIPSNPLMPEFTNHFEYWPTIGAFPFSQATDLRCGGWIRHRQDRLIDTEMVAALLDAWWPSVSLALNGPRPMGTISCTIDFSMTESFEQTEPCLLENTCVEVHEGYAVENNVLWSAKGRVLARAQQNVVIIR